MRRGAKGGHEMRSEGWKRGANDGNEEQSDDYRGLALCARSLIASLLVGRSATIDGTALRARSLVTSLLVGRSATKY